MKSTQYKKAMLLLLLFGGILNYSYGQYYKTNGTQIVNGSGAPVFFSGMNLGNWLVWEGYLMMGDFNYRTHSQFFNSVKSSFGGNQTQAMEFQHQWRMNYVTEQTIIDLKNRGFNSVRVPFHHNLFWNGTALTNDGFQYFDRLIGWCRTYGISILLDMHAAPGYQNPGDHCDNNNSNSSQPRTSVRFWDDNNVNTASQIWKHIATRYVNEPVIWGYDLINEPVPQDGREYQLLGSFITIKNAIRQVDNNHIIVAEGSWWASDLQKLDWMDGAVQSNTGVKAKWDNNLVYQTHHYSTDVNALNGRKAICNKLNIPMILGEYGENDEAKVLEMTNWCRTNNVAYFPWSFKKMFHDKCLWTIPGNTPYNNVRNFINNGGTPPANAYNDMIAFCNNNIANGKAGQVFHDGFFNAVKPIVASSVTIQAESYSSIAGGMFVEGTTDAGGGSNIAGSGAGKWVAYNNINFPTTGTYIVEYRVATALTGRISCDLNSGSIQLGAIDVSTSGGWQSWKTVTQTITVNAGTYSFGVFYVSGQVNINWIKITKSGGGRLATHEEEIAVENDGSSRIFPNPVHHTLHYTLPKGVQAHTVLVRDILGKSVSEHSFSKAKDNNSMDVSTLKEGIYFITLSDKTFNKTFKMEKE